jgi:hypothetical protein
MATQPSIPPILILKEGTAAQADIDMLRQAGLLVLVVKDVRDVRYMDPPITPATRFERCARIIAKKLAKGETIYTTQTQARLVQALLEDVSPPEADEIAGVPPNA